MRRDTSADSAARFLAMRRGREFPSRIVSAAVAERKRLLCAAVPRRIACDFAEPTLRLIHEVLCDRISWAEDGGNKLNLLIIAEQMVGAELGEPPAWPDDPPLTDRGTR